MSKSIYPYTYQITYLPTQQAYIGVRLANNVLAADDFWHIYWTSSAVVKTLIDQHGRDAFRIDWIREYATREEATAAEMILLKEHDVVNNPHYLNQAMWPLYDNTGRKPTDETREKISKSMQGIKRTPEEREKMLGRPKSAETRRKLSEAHKGKVFTEAHRKKLSEACKGKKKPPRTEEHKRKLRKPKTEEHKRALRNAWVKRRIREQDEQ